jgi:hypothetical protein
MNDKTAGNYWNVQRAGEIKLLAQVVERMVREPMSHGDA